MLKLWHRRPVSISKNIHVPNCIANGGGKKCGAPLWVPPLLSHSFLILFSIFSHSFLTFSHFFSHCFAASSTPAIEALPQLAFVEAGVALAGFAGLYGRVSKRLPHLDIPLEEAWFVIVDV